MLDLFTAMRWSEVKKFERSIVYLKKFEVRFRFYWRPLEGFHFHWRNLKGHFFNFLIWNFTHDIWIPPVECKYPFVKFKIVNRIFWNPSSENEFPPVVSSGVKILLRTSVTQLDSNSKMLPYNLYLIKRTLSPPDSLTKFCFAKCYLYKMLSIQSVIFDQK